MKEEINGDIYYSEALHGPDSKDIQRLYPVPIDAEAALTALLQDQIAKVQKDNEIYVHQPYMRVYPNEFARPMTIYRTENSGAPAGLKMPNPIHFKGESIKVKCLTTDDESTIKFERYAPIYNVTEHNTSYTTMMKLSNKQGSINCITVTSIFIEEFKTWNWVVLEQHFNFAVPVCDFAVPVCEDKKETAKIVSTYLLSGSDITDFNFSPNREAANVLANAHKLNEATEQLKKEAEQLRKNEMAKVRVNWPSNTLEMECNIIATDIAPEINTIVRTNTNGESFNLELPKASDNQGRIFSISNLASVTSNSNTIIFVGNELVIHCLQILLCY